MRILIIIVLIMLVAIISKYNNHTEKRIYFKYMEYKMLNLPVIHAVTDSSYYIMRNDSLYVFIIK
jgi:hypothetical protein